MHESITEGARHEPLGRTSGRTPAEWGAVRERSGDGSGVHVWLVLMKAHRSMVRHAARSIASLDMCISDFGVLEVLLHKGPQSVSEIGRRVDLTPDGKALITQVFATHKQAMERAAQGLSKAERVTLVELLKKLGTTAERQLTEGDRES